MNGSSRFNNNKNSITKSHSSGSIMSFPTVREQVELCRHIASQLVANDNARSKGANMFFKRVKKAHTWEVPPLDYSNGPFEGEEDEEKMRQKLAETLLNSHERSATQNLSLVLDPRGRLHSLSSLKAEGIMVNEHDAVSPIVMSRLIKDLESPEANPRAFELFSKRKQMSQEWEIVSNGTRDPKVSTLTTVEEKKVVEEEKENKKEEFVPMIQPVMSQPVVNLRRNSSSVGRKSVTTLGSSIDVGNKRFSLLDPDHFVPAVGSSLVKSGMFAGTSSVVKAPLPWGVTRSSQSQTPEPVSQKILSSTSASPAFSMIESSSNSILNNYLHSNNPVNPIPVTKPISSSLASSTGKLSSMSTNTLNNSSLGFNSSNYGLNTAINNFNRNYYFNTLPAKSYGGSSTNLRNGGYQNDEVKLRPKDNYNKFCSSNNRKSANYSSYDYNKIMGITSNQQPMANQNPYANLPETILL